MSKINLAIISLLSILAITACDPDDDPIDLCSTDNVTYTNAVKSILDNSCAQSGCHSADSAATIGSLANYSDAVDFVGQGRILGAINHEENFKPMPYPAGSAQMPGCDINIITAWINDGTPE